MRRRFRGHSKRFGFTLIELMIVVSIIGILAAIAIPKFSDMTRKAREGAILGSLGSLRSALNIYYADMEGEMGPRDFNSLTLSGKYLSGIPVIAIPNYHSPIPTVKTTPCLGCDPASAAQVIINVQELVNQPGWEYGYELPATQVPMPGIIYITCSHTDSKGYLWSTY